MDFTELNERLIDLSNRYRSWEKPLEDFFQENLHHINQASTLDNLVQEQEQLRQQLLTLENPVDDLCIAINEMCNEYLSTTAEDRAKLIEIARDKKVVLNFLVSHINQSAKELRATKHVNWLRIGLAAASIENGRTDFRDVLTALADLYVVAEETGIDPKPHFQAVAQMSNDAPCFPDGSSIRKMLAEFHTFAVLRERKGEITDEEKADMEEIVKKDFEDQLRRIEQPKSWWKRIFGRQ